MHIHTFGTPIYTATTGKYVATCSTCDQTVSRSEW